MRPLVFFLLCLLLLSAYGVYVGLTHKPAYVHDPDLRVEVPMQEDGEWKLIPPREEGKRRGLGALSPETLRQIEIETARELFSGKGRNPMEKVE